MQVSYQLEAQRQEIYAVLDAGFPGLVSRIELARALGWEWEQVTTPFVSRDPDTGQAVAHVGVLQTRLWLSGQKVPIAGVHAVCCKPEFRGRGHMGEAMKAALDFVDSLSLPALLTCESPEIYRRFGFVDVPERRGRFARPPGSHEPPTHAPMAEDALEKLHASLPHRAPVSPRFSMADAGWVFGICEVFSSRGLQRIHTDGQSFIACEVREGVLELYDVVCDAPLSPSQICGAIGGDFDEIRLHFPPDRWGEPEAWEPMPDDEVLMLRGDLDLPEDICLPATARW